MTGLSWLIVKKKYHPNQWALGNQDVKDILTYFVNYLINLNYSLRRLQRYFRISKMSLKGCTLSVKELVNSSEHNYRVKTHAPKLSNPSVKKSSLGDEARQTTQKVPLPLDLFMSTRYCQVQWALPVVPKVSPSISAYFNDFKSGYDVKKKN